MPRDGFALAVRVRCKIDGVAALGGLFELADELLFSANGLIDGLEVVLDIDAQLALCLLYTSSMIPALHDAEFVRYGVVHRNTYLRSPGMLDRYYRLIADDRIAFAGQMTGVEGYIESAASGFLAGIEMARRLEGKPPVDFPRCV